MKADGAALFSEGNYGAAARKYTAGMDLLRHRRVSENLDITARDDLLFGLFSNRALAKVKLGEFASVSILLDPPAEPGICFVTFALGPRCALGSVLASMRTRHDFPTFLWE